MELNAAAIGRNIRQAREAAGLTQQQLADRTGLHRYTVLRWEQGRFPPSLSTLYRVAEALNVEATALLDAAGDPTAVAS